jgi:hypothetical protein
MSNSRPWEIYTLGDPRTSQVRYVGVTFRKKARYREHLSRAVTGSKTHRDCWIRSLIASGVRPLYEVIESGAGDGWQEAERRWIAHYRPLADLTNSTEGGDGAPGYAPTPELRQKWSKMRAGVPYAPGRVSAMKGKKHTPEAVAKIQAASKGRKMPDSMRQKLSALRRQNPISLEQQSRMGAASRVARQTDEFRQKAIASHAHQSKRVLCLETDEVFPSIKAAARAIGASKSAIQFALQRGTPCKGYTLQLL